MESICNLLQTRIRHDPSVFKHVAALPWETKNSNFLQMWKKTQINCIFSASNSVIHPQVLIFSVFKIARLSHTDCK